MINIIIFEKSAICAKYKMWMSETFATDFCYPPTYTEDGDLLSDWEFDEDGYNSFCESTLFVAETLYEKLGFGKGNIDHMIFSDSEKRNTLLAETGISSVYNELATYGTMFFFVVADYPNYKTIMGNRWIRLRRYLEVFTYWFYEIEQACEWLNLYSLLSKDIFVLELPAELKTEKAMKYLRKLQDAGFLDNKYKFGDRSFRRNCSTAYRYFIAYNLYTKLQCNWDVLEKHFEIQNQEIIGHTIS